jgi:hypothetical protein
MPCRRVDLRERGKKYGGLDQDPHCPGQAIVAVKKSEAKKKGPENRAFDEFLLSSVRMPAHLPSLAI